MRLAGWVFVGGGAIGISHFVLSAALVRFPTAMLSSFQNWVFIGLHALLSAAGLILLGMVSDQRH